MKEILGKVVSAAHSWGDEEVKNKAQKLKETLSQSSGATTVEQWAINPAVHYNEWANFGKTDFLPVVQAFKNLVESFECPTCNSWLHIAPKFKPESLRCTCGAINFNMNLKPK